MQKHVTPLPPVTVIGLGQIGLKLVELLSQQNTPTAVWNRTIAKANALQRVTVAETLDAAIRHSPAVVICVHDYPAVNELLTGLADKSILRGKTIINLTTGSPGEVQVLERWLDQHGAPYLAGAIQVAPDQLGQPDTTILVSGNQAAFSQYENLLRVFGGNIKYLGGEASAASTMDLATLAWLYGSYIGLLHGAALAERANLKLSLFSDIIAEITGGFTEFFQHELQVIEKNEFAITQSPLSISVSATQRIRDAVGENGLDTSFFESVANLLQKAQADGYQQQELAALIKVIRRKKDSLAQSV
ncbi:NAD(P)-binding domain-containing protein [Hymenobacter sp.]|uniref:NAD(P)-dependent oxidoreductase n=1 Tax=Hymenobacter sp. TaxID=1898978 RepID=UPI00286C1E99|nr:NAD(P)-binding domain-containing protein [Hymenobacter sp.]